MTKLAYSYIRFSQSSQSEGGSLERQDTSAQEYAAKKGLKLDTKLNMRDLGISGYTGRNVIDGALSTFLKAIEEGKVPTGSFLLVEDIDRLSRLPVMEALAVFQRIINGGVTLVTLTNEQEYSRESLNDDWFALMPILVNMGRANGESARKSKLLGKAWKKKKENAANLIPLGNNAPLWMTYTKEEGYALDPERTEIVRRIFRMSIEGRGRTTIAKTLNTENVKPFKRGTWGNTSLSRLLVNRAVLGEYQPYKGSGRNRQPDGPPVVGFFPSVIDETTFNRAQAANESRFIHRTTRQRSNFNVWQGIAACHDCGSSMHCISKGRPPKGYTYLTCSAHRHGPCMARPVRLDASELIFREILAKVGDKSIAEDRSAIQAEELQAAQGKLSVMLAKHDATSAIFEDEPSATVAAVLRRQEASIDQIQAEITALKLSLASDTIIDKEDFFAKLDLVSYEGRAQANGLLKRLMIRVRVQTTRGIGTSYIVIQERTPMTAIIHAPPKIQIFPLNAEQLLKLKIQGGETSEQIRFAEAAMAAWPSNLNVFLGPPYSDESYFKIRLRRPTPESS